MPNGFADFGVSMAFLEMWLGLLLGIVVVVAIFALVLGIAFYVLQSLSTYTIAKRRGIHKPWLAWIPVGNMWILGSIADQYQYVAKGKVKNRRKVLIGLTIGMYVLMIPSTVMEIIAIVQTAMGQNTGLMGLSALIMVCNLALCVVSVVAAVYQYIAVYDLFSSCQPSNNVLYLVLSIVFPVTLPVFLLVCRKKDEGMPPRKRVVPQQIEEDPEPAVQTSEEPEQEETPEEQQGEE